MTLDFDSPIGFTEAALLQLRKILKEHSSEELEYVRLYVKGSSCNQLNYGICIDKIRPQDREFAIQGLKVLISENEFMHLFGKEIGYLSSEGSSGFEFREMNSQK